MNFTFTKGMRVHFVGIKGVAMAALALYCNDLGVHVTGSDISAELFPTDEELAHAGITVFEGFAPDHIAKVAPNMVVYTGAHNGRDNVEVCAAVAASIPVFPQGKALGHVMEGKRQISVAGSHGKTTTSSMIATILAYAKQNPSYAVGCGAISGLGSAGHAGTGAYFVAEADEYVTEPGHDATPRFLWQKPEILVVTNIDYDHPDVYGSLEDVQRAFVQLQTKQTGDAITIVNADDPASSVLRDTKNPISTYGFDDGAMYRIMSVTFQKGSTEFAVQENNVSYTFTLHIPGRHNVSNATAAIAACRAAGLSWQDCIQGLATFHGTKRRFEKLGDVNGILWYDDYAHHPKEIQATLAGAKAWYPNSRIITIFQPHTYSRTKALLDDFAHAFADSTIVLLTDIYASAREHETLGINGQTLVTATQKNHPQVTYTPDEASVAQYLHMSVTTGDIIIFMGAGNIYVWGREIVQKLTVES